jgi:MFS family permease
VLFTVTLFSLGNSSDMFLVLRAESAGIRVSLAPLLGLVFNLTYTLAAWPAGRLSDRMSRRTSGSLIWGAMALYGLFYALTAPVSRPCWRA